MKGVLLSKHGDSVTIKLDTSRITRVFDPRNVK